MDRALADLGRDTDQCLGLLLGGRHGRHRTAPVPQMEPRPVGREPQRPAPDRLGDDGLHLVDLLLGGRSLVGLVAHDEEPDSRVPHIATEVDQDTAALDRSEILGIRLEIPGDAGLEGGQAHVLHLVQRPQERSTTLRTGRRQAVPTVPGDHPGHALPTRGSQVSIPQDLRVIVRVDVDESGSDQPARGVDLPSSRYAVTDFDDPAVGNADIGDVGGPPRPVDHGASPDTQCEHGRPRALSRSPRRRAG